MEEQNFMMVIKTDHGIDPEELNEIKAKIINLIQEETGTGCEDVSFTEY